MLASEHVDGEIEGGVDDHEELHRGGDEHVPERGVVPAPVPAREDAADVGRLIHARDQPGCETCQVVECVVIKVVECVVIKDVLLMLVACPGPEAGLLKFSLDQETLDKTSFAWD